MVAPRGAGTFTLGTTRCSWEKEMSRRHDRRERVLPPREETRAHAHNERHRVHAILHEAENQLERGVEPLDVVEPLPNFKAVHHHDAVIGRKKAARSSLRHWKTRDWKRRKSLRRQRAAETDRQRRMA